MIWYEECELVSLSGDKDLWLVATGHLKIKKIIASTFRHIPGEDYSGTFVKFEDENGKIHKVIVAVDIEGIEDKNKYLKDHLPKMIGFELEE